MHKPRSQKFWITFIALSAIFLLGWFVFWEVKNQGIGSLKSLLGALPAKQETKTDLETVISLADAFEHTDGREEVFLILFQNNLELRPGGGFIGSFGILKVKDGVVTDFAVHDTGNFDGRIPNTVLPPYPMRETLHIDSWKLRDSNYSPDFGENAKWAKTFYAMGQGQETFDGVVAVTGNVLTSLLRVTGPVQIEGYPGTYGADNALIDLEYQVEQGYLKQNIAFGDRKSVMGILGKEILRHIRDLSLTQKYELYRTIMEDLHRKDIQLALMDERLHDVVAMAGWDGAMDARWKDDYLFLVDANLNSFKSDYYVERSYAYQIDLSQDVPEARLAVTYNHMAQTRNWFVKDYQTFLRVYVPKGSYLKSTTGTATDPVYGEFMGKKYFGALIQVPIMTQKTVVFEYALPKDIEQTWYDLKIEKQPGLSDVPVNVTIIQKNGTKEVKNFVLDRDTLLGELP